MPIDRASVATIQRIAANPEGWSKGVAIQKPRAWNNTCSQRKQPRNYGQDHKDFLVVFGVSKGKEDKEKAINCCILGYFLVLRNQEITQNTTVSRKSHEKDA